MILAEYTFHMNSADIFGFLHKIIIPDIIRHDSHIKDNTFTAKLCTGNILGPFQINYITVVLKVIEFPSPVRSYHQNINIILNNVIDLLSLIFFQFKIVGTREGTVISALCTGMVVKFFTKWLTAPLNRILVGSDTSSAF